MTGKIQDAQSEDDYAKQLGEYKRWMDEYDKRLEGYENRQSELQDRWVITTSGAALAITLSFVRELDKPLVATWTLVSSWALLSVGVLAILFSIAVGRVASRKMLAAIRENPNGSPPDHSAKISSRITKLLNWLALFSLVLGLAAVVAFGALNLGSPS